MNKDAFWDLDEPGPDIPSNVPQPVASCRITSGASIHSVLSSVEPQPSSTSKPKHQVAASWTSPNIQVCVTADVKADPECFQDSKLCCGYWQTYEACDRRDHKHSNQQFERLELPVYADEIARDVSKLPSLSEWQLKPRVVLTKNKYTEASKFLDKESLIHLSELIPSCDTLEHALITSYAPFDRNFLIKHVPLSAAVTFISSEHKGVIFSEPDDRSAHQATKWICLEHGDRVCFRCKKALPLGVKYYGDSLKGSTLCETCFPMFDPNIGFTVKDRELKVIIAADKCQCVQKRPVLWISPKLASREDAYSLFHGKLMLLLYKSHLRLVISSFNVSKEEQWDGMTDSFWICDFKRVEDVPIVIKSQHQFFVDLIHFVRMTGAEEWAQRVEALQLDLSALTKDYVLISSIPQDVCAPGENVWSQREDKSDQQVRSQDVRSSAECSERSVHLHGMKSLQHALSNFRPPLGTKAGPVFIGCFSIGGAGLYWVNQFADAVGVNLGPELRLVADDTTKHFDPELRLRICGSMWRADTEAAPLHSHSKQMIRAWMHPACSKLHGWTYVGSHNFSKASWGLGDGTGQNLWELGVISNSSCSLLRHRSASVSATSARCCEGWSLSEVPFLFDVGKVVPFSWFHSIRVRDFDTGKPKLLRSYMRVSKQNDAPTGCVWVQCYIDKGESITLRMSQAVWPTSLPFPPQPDTIFYGRFYIQERKIVWVERVFHMNATRPSPEMHFQTSSLALGSNRNNHWSNSRHGLRADSRAHSSRVVQYSGGNDGHSDQSRLTPAKVGEASVTSNTNSSGKYIPPHLRRTGDTNQRNSRNENNARYRRRH